MKLYDLLRVTAYWQKFNIFVGNAYDQNIPVGKGVRAELLDEGVNEDTFDHLGDKVDCIRLSTDGETLIVFLRDENFNVRAEELYSEKYVEKWDNRDASTRPWLHTSEIEVSFQ